MKHRVGGALLAIGLAGILATTAFATSDRRASDLKVGVSLAGYSTDFWSSYVAFEKAAGTKYGVSLVGPISSNGDAGKQATQIRTLIDEGVNALIVNPVDSAAIAPTLDYAASKHIPVVSGPNAIWDAAPDQPYVVGIRSDIRELPVR